MSVQYDQILQDLSRPHRREPCLCLHEHLHLDGFKMIYWFERHINVFYGTVFQHGRPDKA